MFGLFVFPTSVCLPTFCYIETLWFAIPAPEFVAPPDVSPMSSTSLKVTWNCTEGHGIIARGQVTEYRVNLLTEQTTNPYAPPVVSQVNSIRNKMVVKMKSICKKNISFCNICLNRVKLFILMAILCCPAGNVDSLLIGLSLY